VARQPREIKPRRRRGRAEFVWTDPGAGAGAPAGALPLRPHERHRPASRSAASPTSRPRNSPRCGAPGRTTPRWACSSRRWCTCRSVPRWIAGAAGDTSG